MPDLRVGRHNPAIVKFACVLHISAKHRVRSGGRGGKNHKGEEKDDAGAKYSDIGTLSAIVHNLPHIHLIMELIGRKDKDYESILSGPFLLIT
jgi:hypothetical protein